MAGECLLVCWRAGRLTSTYTFEVLIQGFELAYPKILIYGLLRYVKALALYIQTCRISMTAQEQDI